MESPPGEGAQAVKVLAGCFVVLGVQSSGCLFAALSVAQHTIACLLRIALVVPTSDSCFPRVPLQVNKMLGTDAVRMRLESLQGISYTEFTYQLL